MDGEELMDRYMKLNCPECGAPLEVWSEEVIDNVSKYSPINYLREGRFLIRHCDNCHRDWENIWFIEEGETSETPLIRKFCG